MRVAVAILLVLSAFPNSPVLQAQPESPESFIGFEVGSDHHLIDWQRIQNYFEMLEEKTDRVHLLELGNTTLGQPFLMAIISSSHNLNNLAKYRNLQLQAASASHLSDADARLLARDNKAVVMILLNSGSAEVASSQLSVELAFRLATDRSPSFRKIREQLIVLLVPSTNPDGLQRTVEWYNKYVGTPHEASPLPRLSHPYAGDDYDNDWVTLNLIESRLLAKQLYREWFPVLVYNQDEIPEQSFRLGLGSVARDSGHKNLQASHDHVSGTNGSFMNIALDELQAHQLGGLVDIAGERLPASKMTPFLQHNMLCVFAQTASAQLATPLFFPRGSLNTEMTHETSRPWQGGWWRLRDVVDYEMKASLAVLHAAASNKEQIIYDFCQRNMDAIRSGTDGSPFAYVIPVEQHDPAAAKQLVDILIQNGVAVNRAEASLAAGKQQIASHDYVILLSQSFNPFIQHTFLNLPPAMGVRIAAVDSPFVATMSPVKSGRTPFLRLASEAKGDYLVSHSSNRSFIAVNRLLEQGKKVFWLENSINIDGETYPPGTIYVPVNELHPDRMDLLAQELSVQIRQTRHDFRGETALRIRQPRIALLQPWTAESDEGWTRFLLEKFEFGLEVVFNARIRKRNLRGDFDTLVLADMAPSDLINGLREKVPDIYTPKVPRSYLNGISDTGIENLRNFVMKGGTLITLGRSCEFAAQHLGLPVDTEMPAAEGSHTNGLPLFNILVDRSQPVAYGMPETAAAVMANNPVFVPKYWSRRTGVAAYFPEDTALDGRAELGKLAGRSVVLDVPMGAGRVVLIGIRAQYRAQTLGTFKFLFNAILLGRSEEVIL